MKGFARNHKMLSAVLALMCLVRGLVGWELSAWIRGQLVAHLDVARGHYRILTLGLPATWRPEYTRLLRERYGIEARVVAGCVVSVSLPAYVEGCNTVSTNAANRKFGRDVFRESSAGRAQDLDVLASRESPFAAS